MVGGGERGGSRIRHDDVRRERGRNGERENGGRERRDRLSVVVLTGSYNLSRYELRCIDSTDSDDAMTMMHEK